MDEYENYFEEEDDVETEKYEVEKVEEVKEVKEVKEEIEGIGEKKYYKDSFLSSGGYKEYIDVIVALLDEDTLYSKAEVDNIIESFLRTEVI